ncbi:uroporphyrinogen decarboxylase chloroplastic [Phtheirospermum japonicum]|uniref:Uroporphyrinogen decarboxylase chloroplastic n=1 Tax=Phtheirospermum japonicum TaxID=374723 RepID=A0A830DGA1_9LAMI|nr:uroporphyrinogen decarboxylase chloroplastic [Phtheirospermum japonicum]
MACIYSSSVSSISAKLNFAPLSNHKPRFFCSLGGAVAESKAVNASEPLLLNAAWGKEVERPPVWLMRQAGRYMKAEYQRRKEKFFDELEIIFANVVMAVIADFMLVYLSAPTIALRPPLALNVGRLAKFFYSCPDNAFQFALPGTSFSLLRRMCAIARNGAKLFAVGTTSSLVGTVVTNAVINARKAVDGFVIGTQPSIELGPEFKKVEIHPGYFLPLNW